MKHRAPVDSRTLFDVLREVIDLPPNVRSMTIRLELGRAAEVECTYFAGVTGVSTVRKKFVLVDAPEAGDKA